MTIVNKIITITCDLDNILEYAKQLNIQITEEQAYDVLARAKCTHARIGFSWDVLECFLNEVLKDELKRQQDTGE